MTPAVAKAVKEKAKAEKRSISSVVNELLAMAISGQTQKQEPPKRFEVKPFPLGVKDGGDPRRLKEMLYEDEIEAFLDHS